MQEKCFLGRFVRYLQTNAFQWSRITCFKCVFEHLVHCTIPVCFVSRKVPSPVTCPILFSTLWRLVIGPTLGGCESFFLISSLLGGKMLRYCLKTQRSSQSHSARNHYFWGLPSSELSAKHLSLTNPTLGQKQFGRM